MKFLCVVWWSCTYISRSLSVFKVNGLNATPSFSPLIKEWSMTSQWILQYEHVGKTKNKSCNRSNGNLRLCSAWNSSQCFSLKAWSFVYLCCVWACLCAAMLWYAAMLCYAMLCYATVWYGYGMLLLCRRSMAVYDSYFPLCPGLSDLLFPAITHTCPSCNSKAKVTLMCLQLV